jgi:hypothetical protein
LTTPGEEIARRLGDLGLAQGAIVRALVRQLGLTEDEAHDALRAADARERASRQHVSQP